MLRWSSENQLSLGRHILYIPLCLSALVKLKTKLNCVISHSRNISKPDVVIYTLLFVDMCSGVHIVVRTFIPS